MDYPCAVEGGGATLPPGFPGGEGLFLPPEEEGKGALLSGPEGTGTCVVDA